MGRRLRNSNSRRMMLRFRLVAAAAGSFLNWLVSGGSWNDSGIWVDTEVWEDQ